MPKPPDTTNQILNDIRRSNALILTTVQEQLAVAVSAHQIADDQLKVAKTTQQIELQQLAVQTSQLSVLALILKTLNEILASQHVYTLRIIKEKPTMSVQPGIGAAFRVIMQDNGNSITPPDGTVYKWSTEDTSDLIEEKSIDGSFSLVSITVTGDDPDRTTMDVTAKGNDPDGQEIETTLTVDIVPGVAHTYTLMIQQLVDPSINPLRGSKQPAPKGRR